MSVLLSIKEVDNKIIKSIEYVVVFVYFKNKCHSKSIIVEVTIKIHLIDDLKTKLLRCGGAVVQHYSGRSTCTSRVFGLATQNAQRVNKVAGSNPAHITTHKNLFDWSNQRQGEMENR